MSIPYGYVYETVNLVNGRMYIGLHSRSEFDPKYLGSGKAFRLAIQKYGRHNFSVKPLVFAESIEDLNRFERDLIKEYRSKYGFDHLYNLDDGGYQEGFDGGKHSEETKRKIGLAHKGKIVSEESKAKMRGKVRSLEHSKRISIALTGKVQSEESKRKNSLSNMGKTPWNKGLPMTEKAKEKASRSLTGRKFTDLHKQKIASALTGLVRSDAEKEKNRVAHLGKVWSEETHIARMDTFVRNLWAKTILAEEAKILAVKEK